MTDSLFDDKLENKEQKRLKYCHLVGYMNWISYYENLPPYVHIRTDFVAYDFTDRFGLLASQLAINMQTAAHISSPAEHDSDWSR